MKQRVIEFTLRPGTMQRRLLQRCAGTCRYVYNKALTLQQANAKGGREYTPYNTMVSWLKEWKKETTFLNQVSQQVLYQTLKDLDYAYKNFLYNKGQLPVRKKRRKNELFSYKTKVKLNQETNKIFLPRIGWITYYNTCEVVGKIKNTTVSFMYGKWRVVIQLKS